MIDQALRPRYMAKKQWAVYQQVVPIKKLKCKQQINGVS
jgi:hypothetical protein